MPSLRALLPIVALGLLQLQAVNAAALDYRRTEHHRTVTVTACSADPTSTAPVAVDPPAPVTTTSKSNPAASPTSSVTPVLPVNGGATELPAPLPNLSYKYTTIGRGFQNYSCPANASAAPVSVGAVAVLFDVTHLERTNPKAIDAIPAMAVNVPFSPTTYTGKGFDIPGVGEVPVIGHHFFTSALVPVFELTTGESIFAKKIAAVPAPGAASKGPLGTGAVPWLALQDNGAGLSKGLGEVYRVVTAGGNPPATCAGMKPDANGIISVNYAAEYWFYSTSP